MKWDKRTGMMRYDVGDVITIIPHARLRDMVDKTDMQGCFIPSQMLQHAGERVTITYVDERSDGFVYYQLSSNDWWWTSEEFVQSSQRIVHIGMMRAVRIWDEIKSEGMTSQLIDDIVVALHQDLYKAIEIFDKSSASIEEIFIAEKIIETAQCVCKNRRPIPLGCEHWASFFVE